MKTILQNKVKFLIMMFLALSFSVYSAPDVKLKSVNKGHKHEYKSQKGCRSYEQQDKKSYKHGKFHIRKSRSGR